MTLIVEDGTNVPNANTYISDAEFVAYCDARALAYPAAEADREPLIVKAKDFVDSKRNTYQGYKTNEDQPLQWPRSDVFIDGYLWPSNEIPVELKNGQAQAAFDTQSADLITNTEKAVKREKVDVLEVEYQTDGSLMQPTFGAVEAWLAPLYSTVGGYFGLNQVIR